MQHIYNNTYTNIIYNSITYIHNKAYTIQYKYNIIIRYNIYNTI